MGVIAFLLQLLCTIWYHFHNLKNVKNTQGEVLLLVKFQADACNVTKSNNRHGCFSANLNPLVPGVH